MAIPDREDPYVRFVDEPREPEYPDMGVIETEVVTNRVLARMQSARIPIGRATVFGQPCLVRVCALPGYQPVLNFLLPRNRNLNDPDPNKGQWKLFDTIRAPLARAQDPQAYTYRTLASGGGSDRTTFSSPNPERETAGNRLAFFLKGSLFRSPTISIHGGEIVVSATGGTRESEEIFLEGLNDRFRAISQGVRSAYNKGAKWMDTTYYDIQWDVMYDFLHVFGDVPFDRNLGKKVSVRVLIHFDPDMGQLPAFQHFKIQIWFNS